MEEEPVESEFEGFSDVDPDDDPETVDPQSTPGDTSVDVTDENRELSGLAKRKAMEAVAEGKFAEAIRHLNEAVSLTPTATMYGTRANVFNKMKRPNCAIRDATAALKLNPHAAIGFKARGMARALLHRWEEAAADLRLASSIDHDEEVEDTLKKVVRNAEKTEKRLKEKLERRVAEAKDKLETWKRKCWIPLIEKKGRKGRKGIAYRPSNGDLTRITECCLIDSWARALNRGNDDTKDLASNNLAAIMDVLSTVDNDIVKKPEFLDSCRYINREDFRCNPRDNCTDLYDAYSQKAKSLIQKADIMSVAVAGFLNNIIGETKRCYNGCKSPWRPLKISKPEIDSGKADEEGS